MKLIDAFKELDGQWTTKGWVMGMTNLNENDYPCRRSVPSLNRQRIYSHCRLSSALP